MRRLVTRLGILIAVALLSFGAVSLVRALWNGRVEPVPDVASDRLEAGPRRQVAEARAAVNAAPSEQRAAAYGALGKIYLVYRAHDPAAASFRNAARLDSRQHEWPLLLAHAHRSAGRLADATAALQSALDRMAAQPSASARDRLPALCMLTEIAIEQRRPADAVRHLEAAIQSAPQAPYPLIRLAQLAAQSGDAGKSGSYYARAIGALAYRPDLQEWIARQPRAASGPLPPPPMRYADPVYESLRELDRSSAGLLRSGQENAMEGRRARALDLFRQAVEANPNFVQARVSYGDALLAAGHRAEALRQLEEAVRLEPLHPGARGGLALAWANDPATRAKAVETADELRRETTARSAPPQLVAAIYTAAGRYDSALAVYRHAAAQSPSEAWPMVGQAGALAASGQHPAARALLEDAVQRFPQDLRLRLMLARYLAASSAAASRDPRRALDLARDLLAIRYTPNRAETVAVALGANGKWQEAIAMLDRTLSRGAADFTPAQRERLLEIRGRFDQRKPWTEPWPFRSSFATE